MYNMHPKVLGNIIEKKVYYIRDITIKYELTNQSR